MEDNGFPKYQWSRFYGQDRNEQFVFRTNDWSEVAGELEKIRAHFAKSQTVTPVNDVKARYDNQTLICPIHGVPLENKVSQKTGKSYKGHYFDGKMCFGR